METQAVSSAQTGATNAASATEGLGGDDFFQLLIAQLVNQDPMEPTSNEQLLNQISSIRDIELSSNLSKSLTSLTEQQRFASAASLIGQQITGQRDGDGAPVQGVVEAVRFDRSGKALLELEDGTRVPLEQIETVTAAERSVAGLIGKFVTGVDRSDPANLRVVEGIVTGSTADAAGLLMLELDTGGQLRMQDVIDVQAADAATAA